MNHNTKVSILHCFYLKDRNIDSNEDHPDRPIGGKKNQEKSTPPNKTEMKELEKFDLPISNKAVKSK
jgi:hypothetical protein